MMTKRTLTTFLFLIIFLHFTYSQIGIDDMLPPDKSKGIDTYYTDSIRADISILTNHLETNKKDSKLLLYDVLKLLKDMIPYEGMPPKDVIKISKKLNPFEEYNDLKAICRMSAANLFMKSGDSISAIGQLNGLYHYSISEGIFDNTNNSFRKFIAASGDFLHEVPRNMQMVISGNKGIPERCRSMFNVLRSRSTLRNLSQKGIEPSKMDLANRLLIMNLSDMFHQEANGDYKKCMEKIYNIMCVELDKNIQTWIKLQYPIEYVVEYIVRNNDDPSYSFERNALHKRQLEELSIQGSGRASYELGKLYETATGKDESPKEAVHYYELSAKQGNAAGTIRLASCLTTGYGIKKDFKRAYNMLKPLKMHADFKINGSLAYAILLEMNIGDEKTSIIDILNYYAIAAEKSFKSSDEEIAQECLNSLYEKYYK